MSDHTTHDHTEHLQHDHDNHSGHEDHHHDHGSTSWGMAAQATAHCLTGCAIGEVTGMVIGAAFGFRNAAVVVLSLFLAFLFGYSLTMWGVIKAGISFKQAIGIALAADTVSIAVMEFIDNVVMVGVPGALDATLSERLFWVSLAGSLLLAFLVTTPVNKFMISRGKGHAVVHQFHH